MKAPTFIPSFFFLTTTCLAVSTTDVIRVASAGESGEASWVIDAPNAVEPASDFEGDRVAPAADFEGDRVA